MPELFHVSDDGPLRELVPRPSPPGTEMVGRPLVWAIDAAHLAHYLLPRECPRVCWARAGCTDPLLATAASRVVAAEVSWRASIAAARLWVHRLDAAGFVLHAACAGYWICGRTATVLDVTEVDDCRAALTATGAELREVADLWPLVDAVTTGAPEFSAIRLRNASPRESGRL